MRTPAAFLLALSWMVMPPVSMAWADPPAASGQPAAAEDPNARLLSEGQTAARAGDHAAALAKYDAALAAHPRAAKVHAYRAVSLTALRRYEDAEKAAEQALAIDPGEYSYHEIAGQLKVAQGKIDLGKALYDKAAELSPENAGAIYVDLAAGLSAKNDDRFAAEVEKALQKSAAATPPHPEALFALGQSYISAGRVEGKTYLSRFIEIASKMPDGKRDETKIRLAKQLIRAIDAVKEF